MPQPSLPVATKCLVTDKLATYFDKHAFRLHAICLLIHVIFSGFIDCHIGSGEFMVIHFMWNIILGISL
jgi:hypothetical protein